MCGLKNRHLEILSLIGEANVIYVDYPIYPNVGDMLIMLGTEHFFLDNKIKVKGRYSYFNFDKKIVADGDVIILQGGGNFGDLYLHHQSIRDFIVENYKKNRIIILPQTIYFRNEAGIKKISVQYKKHPDLHFFVRDEVSETIGLELANNVYLMPDMAHQLWGVVKSKIDSDCRGKKKLGFFRTDGEVNNSVKVNNECYDLITDWPDFIGNRALLYANLCRLMKILDVVNIGRYASQPISKFWLRHVNSVVNEAIFLFMRFDSIDTDRLHGHILSMLLSIPNSVYDNSYGKNRTYIDKWTAESNLVNLVISEK